MVVPSQPSAAKVARPGTWHDADPDVAVPRSTALIAWQSVATGILQDVASAYGKTVTYGMLKNRLFDDTGYRTRQLVSNWIAPVLGAIQRDTETDGLPPLTSLVVHLNNGQVGSGYITQGRPKRFDDPHEREMAAATDRLACYRAYAHDVPDNAQPQLTKLYKLKRARDLRVGKRSNIDPASCPGCHEQLPATGVCDRCD